MLYEVITRDYAQVLRDALGKGGNEHGDYVITSYSIHYTKLYEPRLIHVGGAGSLVVKPGVLYADELRKGPMPKWLEVEIQGQILALEYLRTVTDVKWSYATPPKNFTNGQRTGKFRIGGDKLMEDDSGKSTISRADFAVALIDEAENAEHMNKRFSVAY